MRRSGLLVFAAAAMSISLAAVSLAQTISVHTVGLNHPNKIALAPDNSLIVSEAGTMDPNTGRISVVDRFSGDAHSLIEGLPSGVNNLGGAPDVDGPSGIRLRGNVLWVTVGTGDSVMSNGPGLELPTGNPSSPIFNSIIQFNLPGGFTGLASPFVMTIADQMDLHDGNKVLLVNNEGDQAVAVLIADLPDYRPEPRMDHPDNVRSGHLYGVEVFQKDLYVVNAAWNLIHKVSLRDGSYSNFVEFPNRPNPLFGTIGGPFIEAVPDNIHRWGNRLIVPLLTGFPFVQGLSEVQLVSLKGAETQVFISNLTSAIDALKVGDDEEEDTDMVFNGIGPSFFTLEFSTNQLGGAPGRLMYFPAASMPPEVITDQLISPTSMARDAKTGDVFITNIFPGTITKVEF